jgi:rhodanese-related sulfurtransferase
MRLHTLSIFTLVVSSALALSACIGETTAHEFISASELASQIDGADAPVVLDVRSPDEYRNGHVPGAINIPHRQVGVRLDELASAKERGLVVYCEGGQRTEYAESVLRSAGFTNIRHLQGDMGAWRQGRLPMATN